MNSEIQEIIKKHHLHPLAYRHQNKVYIIEDRNHKYALKLNTSNYDIYKYLLSRDFVFFPENFNDVTDNYDLSEYIDDVELTKDQKINDLLLILASLHHKTSYMREIALDEIKKIYEDIQENIQKTKNYYLEINDVIDKELFLSPSMYLLARNISLIYYMLEYAKNKVNDWYQEITKEKSVRVSLLHNNVDINHLIVNNNHYLISWDRACFDNPIYDIVQFYQKYFHAMNLMDVLRIYESKNTLSNQENDLLLVKLAIPKKIKLTNNTYQDTILINDNLLLLNKVYQLISSNKINDLKDNK